MCALAVFLSLLLLPLLLCFLTDIVAASKLVWSVEECALSSYLWAMSSSAKLHIVRKNFKKEAFSGVRSEEWHLLSEIYAHLG